MAKKLSEYVLAEQVLMHKSHYESGTGPVDLYRRLSQVRYELLYWPLASEMEVRSGKTKESLLEEEQRVAELFDAAEEGVRAQVFIVDHHAYPFVASASKTLPTHGYYSDIIEKAWAGQTLTNEEQDALTAKAMEGQGSYRAMGWSWVFSAIPGMQKFLVKTDNDREYHVQHALTLASLKRTLKATGYIKKAWILPFKEENVVHL